MRGARLVSMLACVILCGDLLGAPVFRALPMNAERDAQILRAAGLGSDGASLLLFFRRHSAANLTPGDIDVLIGDLGSRSFAKRERASKRLVILARPALVALRKAQKSPDAEVAHRAELCIQQIEVALNNPDLPLAAARRLLREKPAGTAEVLLLYLPFAISDETVTAIWYGLDALTERKGKIGPALLAALRDPLPARRGVVACIVGNRGDTEQRAAVRRLLADPETMVRLRAAQGLLAAKDKTALPPLIALLEQPNVELSWQAEELLHWAASDHAPKATVGAASRRAREQCRRAWQAWWESQGGKLDLNRLVLDFRRPVLYFACENLDPYDGGRQRIWLGGCDGKPRWQLDPLFTVTDVQLIPGNRLLIAQQRGSIVGDMTLDGRTVWLPKIAWVREKHPLLASCRRLANGNTLVAAQECAAEISPDGKLVRFLPGPFASYRGLEKAISIPNGNTLQGRTPPVYGLTEIDQAGKTVWECLTEKRTGFVGLCLPLIRVGFRRPPTARVDMNSVNYRIHGLESKDPRIRRASAVLLEGFGQKASAALRPLIMAAGDPDEIVRKAAGRTLEAVITPMALPELLRAVKAKNAHVRAQVIRLLGRFYGKHKDFLPVLLVAIHDKNALVRREAVGAIHFFVSDCRVVKILIKALKDTDVSTSVREMSVGQIAATELGSVARTNNEALRALTEAARHGDTWVRYNAIRALGVAGAGGKSLIPAVLPTLIEVLNDKTETIDNRAIAAGALSLIGPGAKDAVPALREALRCKEAGRSGAQKGVTIRGSTLAALRNLGAGARDAVPELIGMLQDESLKPSDRQDAAEALGGIGPAARPALPALTKALNARDKRVREAAAEALKKLKR